MNLAQIRIAVRDLITAGGGTNINTSDDDHWNDSEINLAINRAHNEVYKIIRRARGDYFTRILRSTDAAFSQMAHVYYPTSLRLTAGVGTYTLPPSFVRMKLITDLSANPARFIAADLGKHEFRILMQEDAADNASAFYYDIIANKTMLVRPIPTSDRDIEIIYEYIPTKLRDFTSGTVSVNYNSTTMTFTTSAEIALNFFPGMEIIVDNTKPDPNLDYHVVKSVDSNTQVTLERNFLDGTYVNANYIASMPTFVPYHHNQMIVCLAASYCLNKGTNPHKEAADIWRKEYNSMVPGLINDLESRQGSDTETASAYLEDEYYD